MLFLFFYIVCIAFVLIKHKESLLWAPLITIVIDILPLYLTGEAVSVSNDVINLQYFRGFVFLLIFALLFQREAVRPYMLQFSVGVYILFIIFRQFLSTDSYTNLKQAILLSTYILFIPMSYAYAYTSSTSIDKVKKILKYSLLVFIVNTIYCTLFIEIQDEQHLYSGSIINLGSLNLLAQYGIVYINIFLLVFYHNLKLLDFILIILSTTLVILAGKRTPIFIFIAGIFVIVFTNRKQIKTFIKPIYLIPILLFFFATYFSLNYTQRNVREKVGELDYFEEGRFIEYTAIYNEIFVYGDIISYLIGHKDSYLARFDDNLSTNEYINSERNLHSDIAIILFSSGLLGLLFYLKIIFSTLKKQLSLRNYLKPNPFNTAFWALFIGLCLNLFADSHTVSTARVIPYMLIGLTLGFQKRLSILENKPPLAE